MILAGLLDDVRVVAAAALFFGALPWLLCRVSGSRILLLASIVRTILFAEVMGLTLGAWRLCLPGSEAAGATLLVLFWAWQDGALNEVRSAVWWRTNFQRLLTFADNGARSFQAILPVARGRLAGLIRAGGDLRAHPWVWVAAIAICLKSLLHVRFLTAAAYSRSLSLQMLTFGQPWTLDGSVAFLAPISFLSGENATAVIRFTNPLLILALAAAAGFAILQITQCRAAAIAGSGAMILLAVYPRTGGELGPGAIASIFWLVALGFLPSHREEAVWSSLLAFMIEPRLGKSLIIYVGSVLVAVALLRVSRKCFRRFDWAAVAVAFAPAFTIAAFFIPDAGGPYQYESSAKVIEKIARDYPRKQWLAVSPVQELVFTYGRGWHDELSSFVTAYKVDQVADPDFRFSFPVQTVFVFVEKKSLEGGGRANPLFNSEFDPATSAYEYYLDREALEFQAASIMSAYSRNHRDVAIFFENPELRVYRVEMHNHPDIPSRRTGLVSGTSYLLR